MDDYSDDITLPQFTPSPLVILTRAQAVFLTTVSLFCGLGIGVLIAALVSQ